MTNLPLVSTTSAPVNVYQGDIGGLSMYIVDGRELHTYLENGDEFAHWIKDRIGKYGFVEDQDFSSFWETTQKPQGGRPRKDYTLSFNMAKELSMVENNARGKEARRYFIDMERKALEQPAPTDLSTAIQALIDARVQAAIDAKLAALQPAQPPSPFPYDPAGPDTKAEVFSMTEGLLRHNSQLTAIIANKIMVACGWMVDHHRVTATGRLLQYKELVEDGLAFGANVINFKTPDVTAPYYYQDSFPKLLELLDEHRHLVFDLEGKSVEQMTKAQRRYYKDSGGPEKRKAKRREKLRAQKQAQMTAAAKAGRRWTDTDKSLNLRRLFTPEEFQVMKAEFYAIQQAA